MIAHRLTNPTVRKDCGGAELGAIDIGPRTWISGDSHPLSPKNLARNGVHRGRVGAGSPGARSLVERIADAHGTTARSSPASPAGRRSPPRHYGGLSPRAAVFCRRLCTPSRPGRNSWHPSPNFWPTHGLIRRRTANARAAHALRRCSPLASLFQSEKRRPSSVICCWTVRCLWSPRCRDRGDEVPVVGTPWDLALHWREVLGPSDRDQDP